jgi:hypothetical protein
MNRRQFLQYTVALAAAASITRLVVGTSALAGEALPEPWIPTQAEVDEWLEYYKLSVRTGVKSFNDIVCGASNAEPWLGIAQNRSDWELYREAEAAFLRLESDRRDVAITQGEGYAAGRDGRPRLNECFRGPSNQAFGWYNYWAVGDADRRGVRLPHSPGVIWPKKLSAPL